MDRRTESDRERMSLEVWFKADIANALQAIDAAHSAAVARLPGTPEDVAYLAGHADALRAVALAFGIEPGGAIMVLARPARMRQLVAISEKGQ